MDSKALYDFLGRLGENNNRPWFQAHKAEWDDLRMQWEADINLLLARMAEWEPRFATLTAEDCTYRIYRDIRFKADKSPYKTWVCAGINIYGKNSHNGGYYIQAGPESGLSDNFSGLFGGVWLPETKILNKLRRAIVDNIEEFEAIINEPMLNEIFPGWTGAKLKRLPKGWPDDSPHAELLKLKEYGKACDCGPEFFDGDWTARASERLKLLKPLIDFLNYSIEE